MAVKTTLEQLEEVQTTISRVLEAQASGIGDKTIQRASLRELRIFQKELKQELGAEQGTSGVPRINYGTMKGLY
jgi:hypothetical protein